MEKLAFDKGSVRFSDADGRLHIKICNISKSTVNPYRGSEIPNSEELGLDQNKIYNLLRDPEELAKAAPTFNNIQVLSNVLVPENPEHVPVNVEDHQPMMTVGSTGTDAEFVDPYLRNSMVIWVAEAIRKIENNEQREISCAYRYVADMTPGVYDSMPYDGVMRNISGNHVSIVEVGRAGPDVIVGDSQLKEVIDMSKKPLSRKAVLAKGALMAFLQPAKLAQDAKVNLDTILSSVAADNFGKMKAGIAAAIKPKLAKDADLADLVKLLDTLDSDKQENVVGDEFPEPKPEDKEKKVAEDEANPHEALLTFLRGKISDEDLKSVEDMLMGEEAEEKEEGLGVAKDAPPEFKGKPANPAENKPEVSKAAMDAAISKAVKDAEAATMTRLRDIHEAEKVVRPYVGEIVAKDSASDVYASALSILGVDISEVPPSAAAYRAILQAQPKPGSQPIAKDSAIKSDLLKDFPNATRLK